MDPAADVAAWSTEASDGLSDCRKKFVWDFYQGGLLQGVYPRGGVVAGCCRRRGLFVADECLIVGRDSDSSLRRCCNLHVASSSLLVCGQQRFINLASVRPAKPKLLGLLRLTDLLDNLLYNKLCRNPQQIESLPLIHIIVLCQDVAVKTFFSVKRYLFSSRFFL